MALLNVSRSTRRALPNTQEKRYEPSKLTRVTVFAFQKSVAQIWAVLNLFDFNPASQHYADFAHLQFRRALQIPGQFVVLKHDKTVKKRWLKFPLLRIFLISTLQNQLFSHLATCAVKSQNVTL
jgi:hypothetical protein